MEHDLPFYFVDVPLLDKSIVGFRPDSYEIIDLEDEAEITRDIPSESIPFMRDYITRNKFAADAINYLFKRGLDCIAHVGGTAHFNINYNLTEKWDPYPKDYKAHIQDFVSAARVYIADSNTGKIHQLR